jgi:hypothetical protein
LDTNKGTDLMLSTATYMPHTHTILFPTGI